MPISVDFKTANADIITQTMSDDIKVYLSALKFKVSLHYRHADASPIQTRKGEIIIHVDILKSCPSVIDLSRAIEKKINRSETLKFQSGFLPLCMVILSTDGYSINSQTIDGISDSLIERSWECLSTIACNTTDALQDWLTSIIGNRSSQSYFALHGQYISSPVTIRNIPILLSKGISFQSLDVSSFKIPDQIWHRDDVVDQTKLIHMLAVSVSSANNSKRIDE